MLCCHNGDLHDHIFDYEVVTLKINSKHKFKMTPDNKLNSDGTDKTLVEKKIAELEAELHNLRSSNQVPKAELQEDVLSVENKKQGGNTAAWWIICILLGVFPLKYFIESSANNSNKIVEEKIIEKPRLPDDKIKELANYNFRNSSLKSYSDRVYREINKSSGSQNEIDYNTQKWLEELNKVRWSLISEYGVENADLIISHIQSVMYLTRD
jgi:hypothetical protein